MFPHRLVLVLLGQRFPHCLVLYLSLLGALESQSSHLWLPHPRLFLLGALESPLNCLRLPHCHLLSCLRLLLRHQVQLYLCQRSTRLPIYILHCLHVHIQPPNHTNTSPLPGHLKISTPIFFPVGVLEGPFCTTAASHTVGLRTCFGAAVFNAVGLLNCLVAGDPQNCFFNVVDSVFPSCLHALSNKAASLSYPRVC